MVPTDQPLESANNGDDTRGAWGCQFATAGPFPKPAEKHRYLERLYSLLIHTAFWLHRLHFHLFTLSTPDVGPSVAASIRSRI